MLTTLLDLFGLACFGVVAYLAWPPLVLLVIGVAALALSRRMS